MAESKRSLVFGIMTRGWEKARDMAKDILADVKRVGDVSKETRREITEAARAHRQAAQQLRAAGAREAPRAQKLQDRADALRAAAAAPRAVDLSAPARVGGLFGQARGVTNALAGAASAAQAAGGAGQAASLASNLALAIPGLGAAITLTIQQVVIPLFQEEARQRQLALQDAAAGTAALATEFQSFKDQFNDPDFAYQLARRANNELLEEEAALDQRGLSPASRGLFEGDE